MVAKIICRTCSEISGAYLEKELNTLRKSGNANNGHSFSHGESIFLEHNIRGIRGEAADGFPSVQKTGLPVLESLISKGYDIDYASSVSLLNLIADTHDTNMIHRTSFETASRVKNEISKLLENNPFPDISAIQSIDQKFINLNLSPGGCADLLGATLFFHYLSNSQDL